MSLFRRILSEASVVKIRFILSLPIPRRLRNFIMWPVASRAVLDNEKERKLANGLTLHTYLGDHLGRTALFYGHRVPYFWEPVTVRLVETLVENAREVLVAGAHIGLVALTTRVAMPKKSRVHTFEPIPELFEIAKKNIALNEDVGEIVINKEALADSEGVVTMVSETLRSHVATDGGAGIESKSTTIDAYAHKHKIKRFDLVLLDLEGYEPQALRGMEKTLAKESSRPKDIIFEVTPRELDLATYAEMRDMLTQAGYTLYIIRDDYLMQHLTHEAPQIHLVAESEGREDLARTRYYNVYATLRHPAEVA